MWAKQSSAFVTFQSSEQRVVENIIFNGPRAHINVNDGFRGGNLVEGNVITNSCRESGDHGPINSWNRSPYLFDPVGDPAGEPTPYKAYDVFRRNFIWANYNSLSPYDSDDGSCYMHADANVMVGGQIGMKGFQDGHDGHWTNNLHTWPVGPWPEAAASGYGGPLQNTLDGHEFVYTGNSEAGAGCMRRRGGRGALQAHRHVRARTRARAHARRSARAHVRTRGGPHARMCARAHATLTVTRATLLAPAAFVSGFFDQIPRAWIGTQDSCFANQTGRTITANNTVFWDSRDTNVSECGTWQRQILLADFQAMGGDPGTVAFPYNAAGEEGMSEKLIAIARSLLFV